MAPVLLARYLLTGIPFALLVPVDLLYQCYQKNIFPDAPLAEIKEKFAATGKIMILATEMVWVMSNMPQCTAVEMFNGEIRTMAPITGEDYSLNEFSEKVPKTIEDWIEAQTNNDAIISRRNYSH